MILAAFSSCTLLWLLLRIAPWGTKKKDKFFNSLAEWEYTINCNRLAHASWQHHINKSQANKQTHYNPILPHPAQNRQSRHGNKGQKKGTQNTSTKQRHNVTKTHLPIKFTSCLQHFQTECTGQPNKKDTNANGPQHCPAPSTIPHSHKLFLCFFRTVEKDTVNHSGSGQRQESRGEKIQPNHLHILQTLVTREKTMLNALSKRERKTFHRLARLATEDTRTLLSLYWTLHWKRATPKMGKRDTFYRAGCLLLTNSGQHLLTLCYRQINSPNMQQRTNTTGGVYLQTVTGRYGCHFFVSIISLHSKQTIKR